MVSLRVRFETPYLLATHTLAIKSQVNDLQVHVKYRVIYLNFRLQMNDSSPIRVSPYDSSQPLRLESAATTRVSPYDSSQPLRLESAPTTRISSYDSSQVLRLESAPTTRASPYDSVNKSVYSNIFTFVNTKLRSAKFSSY